MHAAATQYTAERLTLMLRPPCSSITCHADDNWLRFGSVYCLTSGCFLHDACLTLQLEVIAWVNNSWETQWISGHTTPDAGRLEVQVGGRLKADCKEMLA
jgi:hypothetical protein